ncbi:MAG TPA: MBL fold metallo-hydrolase [Flavihumibacter sp.]|nr:MBL fold metallo-hydrolase [Flavihumibacter sp.]HQD08728.1 MBL fold metallo-hydrolase [Flavihumibacter sp.]
MSLFITSLNSGSNGNCYYVGNDQDAVLVDVGISARETLRRMQRLGLSPERIKAIFVSHEHGDHITGIVGLSRKYNIPVYISAGTHEAARLPINDELRRHFNNNELMVLGSLQITAFTKAHDAADPYSFTISDGLVNVGVFTDIGRVCANLIRHFKTCHAAFLEANYCEQMLANGSYPFHLKRRISGGRGHLSNNQALDLFTRHRHAQLSHLILAHLSKNNNDPDLVNRLFSAQRKSTQIFVASRYHEMPLLTVRANRQMALF